ncbi:hypothetical protein F2P79_012250 [Pimephales promelas]|nr:hypothetical protein F2P79_012250 [Pimephales promelas]
MPQSEFDMIRVEVFSSMCSGPKGLWFSEHQPILSRPATHFHLTPLCSAFTSGCISHDCFREHQASGCEMTEFTAFHLHTLRSLHGCGFVVLSVPLCPLP